MADTPDQRERLVDTALQQFAVRGIAATSLREIAREAGVTPALVTYYFGNKEALVSIVIETRLMPALLGVIAGMANKAPSELIPWFVQGVNDLVQAHPWFPAMWVREILVDGGALRERVLERLAPKLPHLLTQRFAEQQKLGALNPDLDPRLLFVSMMGLTLFTHAARPIWTHVFDADDIGPEQLKRHTLALLERGLEIPHEK